MFAVLGAVLYAWGLKKAQSQSQELARMLYAKCCKIVKKELKKKCLIMKQIYSHRHSLSSKPSNGQAVQKTAGASPFIPEVQYKSPYTAEARQRRIKYQQIPMKSLIVKHGKKQTQYIFQ